MSNPSIDTGTPAPATEVRRATTTDVRLVTGILARAFASDPINNWLVRDDEHREAGLEALMEMSTLLALPHDEVYVTAGGEGAALWTPPDRWQLGPDDQERFLPQLQAAFGPRKFERSMEALDLLESGLPQEPHFYLLLLGVDPSHQGKGFGSVLLGSVLSRLDAEGWPAYLEATSPSNVPLYLRHGFAITEELRLPGGGPPFWRMWRTPQPLD